MSPEWIHWLNTSWLLFGLKIPAVTAVMAGLIFAFTVILMISDWLRVKKLLDQLMAVTEPFKSLSKPVTLDLMGQLENVFQADTVSRGLKDCWQEFKETLVKEEVEQGHWIFQNTLQAEQFFTQHFVFSGLIPITNSLPALATGFGLLGTFIALLCGLAELHVADGGSVSGIGPFINALSGKFFSSIIGLACALVATVYLSAFRGPSLQKKLHDLQHQINILFPRKSAESILLELKKELGRVDKSVGHLANDMTEKLPEAIHNSIGGDIGSLLDSINGLSQATQALKDVSAAQLNETLIAVHGIKEGVDKLHGQNSDAITESIRNLMNEFKENMHGAASSEMQQLTDNLGQAAQFLQGMEARSEREAIRQAEADARMDQLVQSLQSASLEQQTHASVASESMAGLLRQLAEQAAALNEQSQESLQAQLRQLQAESEQQGREWQQKMQELVAQSLTQFQDGSQRQLGEMSQQSNELAEKVSSLLLRFDESGRSQQQQSEMMLTAMREQMSSSASDYGQQLEAQQVNLTRSIEEALAGFGRFMETRETELQHAYRQLEKTQRDFAETLSTGTREFQMSLGGMKEALQLNQQSVAQLNTGQKQLSGSLSLLNDASGILSTGMGNATTTAAVYAQTIGAMQKLHDRQSVVYGELETRLITVLDAIRNNLGNYTTLTNQAFKANNEEWDKQLREAASTFAGLVSEVKDSADTLAEAMEDMTRKLPKIFTLTEKELGNVK